MARANPHAPKLGFVDFWSALVETAQNMDRDSIEHRTIRSQKQADKKKRAKDKEAEEKRQQQLNSSEQTTRKSKWWVEPSIWAKMSVEERQAHLKKKREAFAAQSTPRTINTQQQHAVTEQILVIPDNANTAPAANTSNQAGQTVACMLSTQHVVAPPTVSHNAQAQQFTVSSAVQAPAAIQYGGVTYRMAAYRVLAHGLSESPGSQVNRGGNGGWMGDDMIVHCTTNHKVDVNGIADKREEDLVIGTGFGKIKTDRGYIIGIFHQYAIYRKGRSIHSPLQFEDFGMTVHDKITDATAPHVKTTEGHTIPLAVHDGLVYMNMVKPMEDEIDSLPHVMFTSDTVWDPSKFDTYHTEDYDIQELEAYVASLTPTERTVMACKIATNEGKPVEVRGTPMSPRSIHRPHRTSKPYGHILPGYPRSASKILSATPHSGIVPRIAILCVGITKPSFLTTLPERRDL